MNAENVHRRRLGHELRLLRKKADLTVEQSAGRLNWPPSKLSRIESGRSVIGLGDLRLILDAYRLTEPAREALLALLPTSASQGWPSGYHDVVEGNFGAYLAMEEQAQAALAFCVGGISGLLQHERYAQAVLDSGRVIGVATEQEVARRLELRLRRQEALHRTGSSGVPLRLSTVIDESALWRAVAGPKAMAVQMTHLLEQARLPNVDIAVLPLAAERKPVFDDTFTVLQFPPAGELDLADIAYVDSLAAPPLQIGGGALVFRTCWHALKDYALPAAESRQLIEYAAAQWRRRSEASRDHRTLDPGSTR